MATKLNLSFTSLSKVIDLSSELRMKAMRPMLQPQRVWLKVCRTYTHICKHTHMYVHYDAV